MRDLNFSGWRNTAAARIPAVPLLGLLLLVLAWVLPGLIGHQPWKPDEGYTFGLVQHIAASGDWVVPMLAGEPFMEKPPIFFITASWCLQAFGGVLPLHDAARLAAGIWLSIALAGLALAARLVYGKQAGRWAIVVALGCLGLPLRAHQLITDIALFAGIAWGLYAKLLAPSRPVLAGVLLGAAGAVALLAKGLLGPGLIGLTALVLPLLSPTYRNRRYAWTLGLALLVGLPLPALWMWSLYQRSADLFNLWFWVNNLGRFNGTAHLGPHAQHLFYFRTLPWYAFPALPLALLALWRARRGTVRIAGSALLPVLLAFGVGLTVLSLAADARELYAMPLLAPLAILAVGALVEYPQPVLRWRIASAVTLLLSVVLVALIVICGFALASGAPAGLAHWLITRRFIGWQPAWYWQGWLAYALILALVLGFWRAVNAGTPAGFVWRWFLLVVALWGGLSTLWLPAFDHVMRYRETFLQLQPRLAQLQQQQQCVASYRFGEPQRAMLDYYDHFRTLRVETQPEAWNCRWLLVGSEDGQLPAAVTAHQLQPVQIAVRPGDARDRFMLFQLPGTVNELWPQDEIRRAVGK